MNKKQKRKQKNIPLGFSACASCGSKNLYFEENSDLCEQHGCSIRCKKCHSFLWMPGKNQIENLRKIWKEKLYLIGFFGTILILFCLQECGRSRRDVKAETPQPATIIYTNVVTQFSNDGKILRQWKTTNGVHFTASGDLYFNDLNQHGVIIHGTYNVEHEK